MEDGVAGAGGVDGGWGVGGGVGVDDDGSIIIS